MRSVAPLRPGWRKGCGKPRARRAPRRLRMRRTDRLPYWREALLVFLVALPWLSLLVLGIVWLWQGGRVWIWALAAAAIGLLSWPLWRSVKRRSAQDARTALGDLAQPSREWHVAERDAWSLVLAIADETAPLSFLEIDPLLAVARNTIEAVARRLHGD